MRKALVHIGIGLLAALVTGVAALVVEALFLGRKKQDGVTDVVMRRPQDAQALRVGLFVVGCG
ncbi:hypothetical protein NLX83_25535 [Allokutzneria sp. A3M-2-11 16]|uniref:hypothetical protein n=1 Tax=Allokutzneria sp. A3M-2-11 16 TaxID=2962043 RepID=UPI0020B6D00B|nr:hypothetical protein [Allokutzneria sp. A3M-2-11 16]MCP3802640.1 hypothetical protein [Allokutzneria sp. A3M-2-11 16]